MPYIKMTVQAGNDEYIYKYHSHRYAKKSERGKNIKPTTKEQKKIIKDLHSVKDNGQQAVIFVMVIGR